VQDSDKQTITLASEESEDVEAVIIPHGPFHVNHNDLPEYLGPDASGEESASPQTAREYDSSLPQYDEWSDDEQLHHKRSDVDSADENAAPPEDNKDNKEKKKNGDPSEESETATERRLFEISLKSIRRLHTDARKKLMQRQHEERKELRRIHQAEVWNLVGSAYKPGHLANNEELQIMMLARSQREEIINQQIWHQKERLELQLEQRREIAQWKKEMGMEDDDARLGSRRHVESRRRGEKPRAALERGG